MDFGPPPAPPVAVGVAVGAAPKLVKVVGIKKGEKLNSVQEAQLKEASGVQPAAE